MGFVKNFFSTETRSFFDYESRSSLENPQTPLSFPAEWLLDIYNGGRTDSGIRVSQLTALQSITLKSCVEIVACAVASLPLHIYEISENTNGHQLRKKSMDPPNELYDIIHHQPNPEMTFATLLETHMAHALLWANAFIEIIWSKGGDVLALMPRNPAKTRPYRLLKPLTIGGQVYPQGTMVYVTTDGMTDYDQSENDAMGLQRAERIILPEDMIHIPGLSLDGRAGLDVIEYARQAIGRKLAMEKYASKFFGNGGRSSMVIKLPGNLTQEQRDAARKSYQEALGGENMLRPIVLTAGIEIEPIEIKNNEAQFNESESALKEDICSLFHVPPHMVGMTEKTTRANTEQLAQEFYQFCLLPWLTKIKQEWKRKLLPQQNTTGRPGKKYIFDFDVDALIRPDADSRQKFLTSMFNVGAWSPNRILEYNGENPIENPDADKTFVPVNMVPLGTPQEPTGPNTPGNNPANPNAPGKKSLTMDTFGGGSFHAQPDSLPNLPDVIMQRYTQAYLPLWKDAFSRALAKKIADSKALHRGFAPLLTCICNDVGDLAKRELKVTVDTQQAFSTFIVEYTRSMSKRYADWSEDNAKPELQRAIKAVVTAAYRELGTARGKEFSGQLMFRDDSPAPDAKPIAYLVEHGATEYTEAGKMHGDNDVDLNEKGQAQAAKAAAWLKEHAPTIKAVYSSDLKRAVQTAQPIAEAYGTKVNQNQQLRPMRIGILSGEPDAALQPYLKNPDTAPPNGESPNAFIQRSPVMDYIKEATPEQPIVMALHSMNIAATTDKIETDDALKSLFQKKAGVSQGGVMSISKTPEGKYLVKAEY